MAVVKPPVVPPWGESISASPDIVQPTDVFIQGGWPLTSIPPSRGFFNWVLKFCANGVRYFSKFGIVDWDAAETYPIGAIVRDTFTDGAGFTRIGFWSATAVPTVGTAPHSNLTHWQLWLASPVGQSTNHTREIIAWQNARKLRRAAIEHFGYQAGKILKLQENWAGNTGSTFATTGGTGVLRSIWLTTVLGTGATMNTSAAASTLLPQSPCLRQTMTTGATVPQTAHAETEPLTTHQAGTSIFWSCDAGSLDGTSFLAHNEVTMGLNGESLQTVAGSRFTGSELGVFFYMTGGTPNWQAVARGPSGGLIVVDTGVAVDAAIHRFKINYEDVSDNGAARAHFFIDGANVANIGVAFTAGMPWNMFCRTVHVSSGNGGSFLQGVVDWNSALWGSLDVIS